MNRLAVFDCDGTLVDSGASIYRALRTAFDAHDLECPAPNVSRKVIGLSLLEAMAILAPEADHLARARDIFVQHEARYDLARAEAYL